MNRPTGETDQELRAFDDNALIDRTLSGCAKAFEVIVDRYHPRLMQLLVARCNGCHQDAEDVVQETMGRAFTKLGRFDGKHQFSTWLFTIALNIASDHRRRNLRQRQTRSLEAIQDPGQSVDPFHLVQIHEQAENLWTVARRVLSVPQYTAMWLKYGEDLSIAEIAHSMGKTQIGVRVLLHRARNLLTKSQTS